MAGHSATLEASAVKRRNLGQKISFVIAILSYITGVGCALYAIIQGEEALGKSVYASFLASVVFFGGVGIVLHVIGTADLPSLKVEPTPRPSDD